MKDLAFDVEPTRALRFEHSTITPGDFKRVIEGDDTTASKARVYSYHPMLERFGMLGGGKEGGPLMTDVFERDGGHAGRHVLEGALSDSDIRTASDAAGYSEGARAMPLRSP